jgi:hypothetical protein
MDRRAPGLEGQIVGIDWGEWNQGMNWIIWIDQTDGLYWWMNGWMDKWMDGQMDGYLLVQFFLLVFTFLRVSITSCLLWDPKVEKIVWIDTWANVRWIAGRVGRMDA